jgi:hypothetical protein
MTHSIKLIKIFPILYFLYYLFFQRLLSAASSLLRSSIAPFYLRSVNVIVPSSWRESKCEAIIRQPNGDTRDAIHQMFSNFS